MDKIQKRWDKLKHKKAPCPECRSKNIHLNRSTSRRLKRYWLECFECHWCGRSRPTIKSAIRAWNKDGSKKYIEMLRRVYGGE